MVQQQNPTNRHLGQIVEEITKGKGPIDLNIVASIIGILGKTAPEEMPSDGAEGLDDGDVSTDDDTPTIPTSVITSLEDKKAVVAFLDKLSPILAAKDDIVRLLPRERKDQGVEIKGQLKDVLLLLRNLIIPRLPEGEKTARFKAN